MAKGKDKSGTPRPGKLTNLSDVRAEMARVYRDAREGNITTSEGSRLVYMLKCVGEILEVEHMEARVARLEERFGA